MLRVRPALVLCLAAALALPAAAQGAFPGKNGRIVYTRDLTRDSDTSGELYTMKADGKDARRVGQVQGVDAPAWSPDGKTLAFDSDAGERPTIFKIGANGTNLLKLTPEGHTVDQQAPAWFPSGARLVHTQGSPRDSDVFSTDVAAMSSAGGASTTLAGGTDDANDPVVSPDGKRIAFVHHGQDASSQYVHVMNSDGSGVKRLAGASNGDVQTPDWSPDGKSIVFSMRSGGSRYDIYVVAAKGGKPKRLTTRPADDMNAVFSPDGKLILLEAGSVYERDLYLMKPDGTGMKLIKKTKGVAERRPDWQRLKK